ncbi:aspartyl/asparaginyl beta-hydroxylase domain-containing protein [Tateyamaria sp. syn59]|uniref:aspartyl/asparaginyl beta-hydroxylase domain-containing protein n=1 Tax=Tateyamaria sp. syn59 TaxID=2576942 RepID=UPI0016744BE2|nr:aspartyl/asparaginyl beta-hydroxylase domain-containing protein [Tateyamaria sp. syn59]
MKYFKRIRSDVDVTPFLNEIASVDDAWAQATGRQDKIAVQREALAVPLRGLRKSMLLGRKRRDVHESRWTTGSIRFPIARAFIEDVATELDADMSRAKIVCLPAGRRVYPHIDRGEYYRFRGRYHFVLKSSAGSFMKAGDEEVRMKEGELWWFDNDQMHEAFNDGDEDRIHIIFDLLPADMRAKAAAATERARAKLEKAA